MSSKKCPKCGLVMFTGATECKRCSTPMVADLPVASEPPPPSIENTLPTTSVTTSTNLLTCPDCGHAVSRYAQACPSCGRFFENLSSETKVVQSRWWWSQTIAWGVIMANFLLGALGVLVLFVFYSLFVAGARR